MKRKNPIYMKNEKHQNEKSMKNTHIQFSTLPLFFFGEFYIASGSFFNLFSRL